MAAGFISNDFLWLSDVLALMARHPGLVGHERSICLDNLLIRQTVKTVLYVYFAAMFTPVIHASESREGSSPELV